MNIKRIFGILLVISMLFTSFPGIAAEKTDISKRIIASDLIFKSGETEIDKIPANTAVTTSLNVERSKEGSGDQDFVIVMQVFDNGKLIDFVKQPGTAKYGEKAQNYTLTSKATGADVSGYEIVVMIVNNLIDFTPLSAAGNFGSSNSKIKSVKIGDDYLDISEKKDIYDMSILVPEEEYPAKVAVTTYDLASKVTVTEEEGTVTIKSEAHDKSSSETYKVNLDVTKISRAGLKNIYIDGKAYELFETDQYEYTVSVKQGTATPPSVTCETYYDDAEVDIVNATTIPGKTVINITADGAEEEYIIKFAKTITVSPSYIGEKQYYGAGVTVWDVKNDSSMPDKYLGNGSGNYYYEALRLNSRNADYSNSTRIGFLNFDAGLPEDAVITDASLNMTYLAGSLTNVSSMTPEIYNATDTGWITNPSSYAANSMPAYGTEAVSKKAIPSATAAGTKYTGNIELDTSVMNSGLNFVLRVKEYATTTSYDYLYIYLSEDNMPELTLSYYSDIVDDGNNIDLSSVTIGGKPFAEFDKDVTEYIVEVDGNSTEVPEVAATPYFDSTTVKCYNADSVPGTAMIQVTSANGVTKSYKFILAKAVTVTPTYIGRKEYWGTEFQLWNTDEEIIDEFLPDSTTFRGESLPLRSFSQSGTNYCRGTAIGYLDFDIELPEDAIIANAELTISYSKSHNNLASNTDTLTPEIFACVDTDWNTKPTKYGVANTLPAFSSEKINTEAFTPATAQGYHHETVKLDKTKLTDDLMFAIRVNEQREGTAKYDWLAVYVRDSEVFADRKAPKLKIVYYLPDNCL